MCTSVRSETSLPPAVPQVAASRSWLSFLIIALVAVMVMTPELVIGMTVTDNYRFNLLWPEQFADLFRAGHLYPRWLPHAWKGLGTPAFYFYPPIFFWLSSLVDLLTGGTLPSEKFVPIATLLVLMSSGFAMFAWLKSQAGERRALIGATAYMVAPYHLYDIYCRGALAEATAFASVPIIMLGLARLGEGHRRYLPLISLGYAALLLTHLPTALLVSILLIPPYVGWTALKIDRPRRFFVQALFGGLIGIGLAAIYLIPALSLLSFVNPGSLTRAFYRPETWFFWSFPSGVHGVRMMLFIIPLSVAATLLAGATLMKDRKSLLWAAITISVVALVAGLIPPFWKLPGLAMVQFPSRALLIVEFAAITMLATSRSSLRSPVMLAGLLLVAFAYVSLGLMMRHTIGRTVAEQSLTQSQIRLSYLDAPEYLPRGVQVKEGAGPDDVEVKIANVPLASASDPNARLRVAETPDGGMTVAVDAPSETIVTLRRYYFPQWKIRDAADHPVATAPDPRARIVTFIAPPGRSEFRLEQGVAPTETAGRLVSLLALLALALAVMWSRRTPAGA